MTREEAIKIIDCYDIGFYDLSGEKIPADKLANAFDLAIEALQHDAIFEQIKWERDVALQTLEEHGIGLGQKAEQVTGKLKNPCDSLLADDSAECKEQKSKLEPSKVDFRTDKSANISTEVNDLISRADAIDAVAEEWLSEASAESPYVNDNDIDRYRELAEELFADIPSADAVSREFYNDAVKANIGLVIENRKLKEQLESADAVQGGDAEMQTIAKTPDYMQHSRHNDGKDLISRKHALRVAKDVEDGNVPVAMIVALIDAIPSAELTLQTPQTYGKSINPSNAEVVEDYISRADAIAYIDRVINSGLGRNKSLDYIRKYISALPSADRPQGEWEIEQDDDGMYGNCSICGNDADFEHYRKPYNYCPNCGAYMGGKE